MTFKKKKFNLNNYIIEDDEFQFIQKPIVPVCLPRAPFRIHPDTERMVKVLIYNHKTEEENKWYLVNPQAVRKFQINGLWQAELYEGIDEDGRIFILPSTLSDQGYESYQETMETAILAARKQWSILKTFKEDRIHTVRPAKRKIAAPVWPDHDFCDVIELAFNDRVINTYEEAEMIFPKKKSSRVIIEE